MTALPATPPGASRITVRPAPRREPPFDDEITDLRLVGPLDRALPFDPWPGQLSSDHIWHSPRPSGRGELPDPEIWGRRILIGVLEARAGRRSAHQLAPFLSPSIQAALARDASRPRTSNSAPRAIRSIRVCEPADGVAELAAVVQVGARFRAIAARLEGLDGRWRCVRLQIG
jgi:hypothetical protein